MPEAALAQPRVEPRPASPAPSPTSSAVCIARARSELTSRSGTQRGDEPGDLVGLGPADLVERRVGLALEAALGVPGRAAVPQQDDLARRHSAVHGVGGAACRRGGVGERDERAVLPQPLEGVEHPLLGVLDVDHDVGVVEQHPAAVALALAADGLVRRRARSLLLDRVDDGLDLPLVAAGGDDEDVGDGEPLADVDEDDVGGELVGGGLRRRSGRARWPGRWRSRAPSLRAHRTRPVAGQR